MVPHHSGSYLEQSRKMPHVATTTFPGESELFFGQQHPNGEQVGLDVDTSLAFFAVERLFPVQARRAVVDEVVP